MQAFVTTISGIIYVDKRYLRLVYGCLEYHRPTIPEVTVPNACISICSVGSNGNGLSQQKTLTTENNGPCP